MKSPARSPATLPERTSASSTIAAHAAPVVAVGVGVDHRRDRQALALVRLEQLPGGARRLGRHQRVDDDPAGLAADEGDVGEVEAAHLVEAGDHLVEAVVVVEPRDAVQRGVDRVELRLLVEELEARHVPGGVAGVGRDHHLGHLGDEPALLLVEVGRVAERQRRLRGLEDPDRVRRRRLALRVEVTGQRRGLLRARRTTLEDEVAGDGEGRAHGRHGGEEFASRGHRRLPLAHVARSQREKPAGHKRLLRGRPLREFDTREVQSAERDHGIIHRHGGPGRACDMARWPVGRRLR